MACVTDKGELSQSAIAIIEAVKDEAKEPAQIASETKLPLFKVRSSMRELEANNYVKAEGDAYVATDFAKARIIK
ncbi:hypothetical protein GOP80_09875 [Planococcaceae bacterium Storch 2/2-2]|nr:hypothetical protein [Planococcaceae bacterium Storch 2/2-2]